MRFIDNLWHYLKIFNCLLLEFWLSRSESLISGGFCTFLALNLFVYWSTHVAVVHIQVSKVSFVASPHCGVLSYYEPWYHCKALCWLILTLSLTFLYLNFVLHAWFLFFIFLLFLFIVNFRLVLNELHLDAFFVLILVFFELMSF